MADSRTWWRAVVAFSAAALGGTLATGLVGPDLRARARRRPPA